MDTRDWITIGLAIIAIISNWGQFWVKERLFTKNTSDNDTILKAFKTRSGVTFIAFTGLLMAASVWILAVEILSKEPLTRVSCFKISALTVLAVLNMVLIHSLFTLRRMAFLKEQIENSEQRAANLEVEIGMM